MAEDTTIEFIGDLVKKWYRQDVVVEFEKAQAMWELSQRSGFVCPEPVELREADSIIVYRNLRVYGVWEPIRSAYLDYMTGAAPDTDQLQVFAEAGRVLGVIHRELELAAAATWVPDLELRRCLERVGAAGERDTLPPVHLHCDYGFSNVLWAEDQQIVATFDPSPDWYSTFGTALRGTRYVDLGQFMSCLEGRVPLQHYPKLEWRLLDGLRDAFLDAYDATAGVVVDRACVRRYGFAIAEANFRDRLHSKAVSRLANRLLYNRFKGNTL